MQANARNNERCSEKLRQMKKYLPFIDFMINKIKDKIHALPLERQLVKFQQLRSMIANNNDDDDPNWNVIVRVEKVIEQLVVKLNYQDQEGTIGEQSTRRLGGEMEGNNSTRLRGFSTSVKSEVSVTSRIRNSSSSTAASSETLDNSNSQNVGAANRVDASRNPSDVCRDDDKQVVPISDMSGSGLNKTWALIPIDGCINARRIKETNLDRDLDGHNAARRLKSNRNPKHSDSPGVPKEMKPPTDSLSSSRGMLTQSDPSTSHQTSSQSRRSHTDSNNRNQASRSSSHKLVSYKNPKYRSNYPERVTMYDYVETPQLCDRDGERRDGDRKHSKERVRTVKDPRLNRKISQSGSSSHRSSDSKSRARHSDRPSSASHKSHGSAKDPTRPKKDSVSKANKDLPMVKAITHRRSRSTGEREREKSHMSLKSEKDRRHSTNSREKDDLSEDKTQERDTNDENPLDKGSTKKINISSLNDNELEKFVKENYQALPHLSTLKPSEIREAIQSLGIETIEEPSISPSEPELQDLDEFMNTQASLGNSVSRVSEIESRDLETPNRSREHQMEKEGNVRNTNPVAQESENVIGRESVGNKLPEVTRDGNELHKNESTRSKFDEFNRKIQPPRKKGLLELPLPSVMDHNEITSHLELAPLSMPSAESNINRGDHVGPSINLQSPMPIIRRHSIHTVTVHNPTIYHSQEVVYDNWMASTLPPPMIPLQGSNPMIRPNTLLDPRLTKASSSQSYHSMLIPMGSMNVCQMMSNPGYQHPNLFSPPLNIMSGLDGKISNASHPSEAKSYAEYKRLKNEEMRKLHSMASLPQISPNTSSESSFDGGLAGEENDPKKTQFFRNPPYRRREESHSFRGVRGTSSRTHRRYSNYDDSRPRYRGNLNERTWKNDDRRKRTDSERSSTDAEETISPLDSLYENEPKLQTGRGYGLQHFKIPKKVRSDAGGEGSTKFLTENKKKTSRVEEDWDRPEEPTITNKDKDSTHKGEEGRDSSEQRKKKRRNDEDVSPKEEEKETSQKKKTNINIKKDTTRKGRGNRDSLQQATSRTQSDRNVSRKSGKNLDIPEMTKKSNKGGRKEKKNVEENVNSRDETVNKGNVSIVGRELGLRDATANATAGGNTDRSDGHSLCREVAANTEVTTDRNTESEVIENTREDQMDQSDGNFPSRETTTTTRRSQRNLNKKSNKVSIMGEMSNSRDATINATASRNTEQSDGNFHCRETAANTKKSDNTMNRNMEFREAPENTREGSKMEQPDGNPPSCETTANTRNRKRKRSRSTKSSKVSNKGGDSNSGNTTASATAGGDTDGNFLCRETAANTEKKDPTEVKNEEQDGFEEGTKTNDNDKNEKGPGDPAARLDLEDWYVKEKIEQEESSNAGLNDTEATRLRESPISEGDSSMDIPLSELSKRIKNYQEERNRSPDAPKENVTSGWVETLVRGHAGPTSKKIVHVLEKISQLSEEKLQTIEKIINSENGSSEGEHGNKEQESRESVGGNAENNNDEVNKSTNQPTKEEQKSPSHESLENEIEGEATGKEMEGNTETERNGTSSDLLASNNNERKSRRSSVRNAKRRSPRPRARRRRVGMGFVTSKRKRRPRKQTQKQLLKQSTSKAEQPEGADAGNLNPAEAQKPNTNRQLKRRTKTEVDRLQEDVGTMFAGTEVMAIMGPRSCRLSKTAPNYTNNSDTSSGNATPVEEQSRKERTQRRSRSTSSRNTKSKNVIPSEAVTHETQGSPAVEEYHKSIKWPRIVMQKVHLTDFRYAEIISDTCLRFSRRKDNNKAVRSEKTWKTQPNVSLTNNEDVPRKIRNKRPKKKLTNKSSKAKRRTEIETSQPERIGQTENPKTRKRSVTEELQALNQRNMSPVRVSRRRTENIDENREDDSLLNYALERKGAVYGCKLCSLVTRDISAHYKIDHPESEILISRLSVAEAADALREAAENDFEDNTLEDTPLDRVRSILLSRRRASSYYYCRMCNGPGKSSIFSFYMHVTKHTGEYRYKCPSRVCKATESKSTKKNDVWDIHHKQRFRLYWNELKLSPMPAELGYLYGFICSKCNFVQVFRENLEKHVAKQHRGDKNIAIIKINLSSKYPPEVAEEERDLQEGPQTRDNDNEPTEQGNPNEDNVENTGHEEADNAFESQNRPEKRKRTPNPRSGEMTGLMDDTNSDEEVDSKRPFLDAELETEIEVHDSHSYLLKPETDMETVSETNLETNLETNSESDLRMHIEPNPEPILETEFEANAEPNLERQQETHLEARLEPRLETNPEANLESDQMEIDGCADLRKFTTIRGSDIIDPLESSDSRDSGETDSRDADSPFTPKDGIADTFKVGPLQAHVADNYEVSYECFVKGCLFNTKSYVTFEKHLKISHANSKWKGNCRVCQGNVKEKRLKHWPTVSFALTSALKHLKIHARQGLNQKLGKLVNPSAQGSCTNKVEFEGTLYPRTPLLRVRNLVGDRLSTPRDPLEITTQEESVGSIAREEPTATCYGEQNTNESLMFTIQDVRSLKTEVGSGSGIQFDEVVSPMKSVRESTKVVTGQPVIVRSCPTRQIAIRPETSVLPIEVGHLQVVQAPVSTSSVVLNPVTDPTPASNEVILGTLPDSVPVCIRSSITPQPQPPRFALQPIMISTPASLRPPTQMVCPVPTPTPSSQDVLPSSVVMEPEPEASTSSSDPNATVEQAVVQSVMGFAEIGMPSTGKVPRRWSAMRFGKGPTLPPSLPGEVADEDSSLLMRSILPFGNKTIKVTEIYEEMLTKEKLCHLFKCMASECSFTCKNQTTFDRHIKLHEADKRGKTAMFTKKGKKMYPWQQCSYCCEVVANPGWALSQHILNVHGHCTYQCAYCFFRAISLNYVTIHQNLAHKDRPQDTTPIVYKCRKLSNGPILPVGWEMQARKQCVRPYHCDQCGDKFLITQEFMDHLVSKHQSVTWYTCHICKNLCFKPDRLIAHYKLHSYATYQCSYCLHGTEAEWEMVLHLCNFHFTRPATVYMRVWEEGTEFQREQKSLNSRNKKKPGIHLEFLKSVTYDEITTPDCILQEESEDEDDGNLMINEPHDLSAIVAELGITTEDESDTSVPIMQELTTIAHGPQGVSLTALLPNARFSSEGESGSETFLISSGLSTSCERENSASEAVETNKTSIPLAEMPLETVNYQAPIVSQPVIFPRFDVSFNTMADSISMVAEEIEKSRATTSSSNLLMESVNVTPNVNPVPPAIHRLPPVVLTTRTGAVGVHPHREPVTAAVLRTKQVEEEPSALSFENSNASEVSCDQESSVVDPFQEESNINDESNLYVMPEACFLPSDTQGLEDENNTEDREIMESSTTENSQEETPNPTQDLTNENCETRDPRGNETEESNRETTSDKTTSDSIVPIKIAINLPSERLETGIPVEGDVDANPTEEPSTSAASPMSLPRTRFSALRARYRNDESVPTKRNSGKSSSKKNCVHDLVGEKLYICGNRGCNIDAPTERELENHLVVCDDSRNFPLLECPHCSKLFKQNVYYLEHLKCHGVKKLSCGLCSYRAALKTSMMRHMKQKHRCKQFITVPMERETSREGYFAYYPKNYKTEKQDFKESGYSPGDEDKLPRQSVYVVNVKCAQCPYFTKVRSNMVRHLKIHVKSAETEGLVVPSTAPMNPVPCLDSKEKMFDKMTNLAASSQMAKDKNAAETLSPEERAKLPQFVDDYLRYKCCLVDCNYITVDDGMLKHHIKALHSEVTYYSCPHCKSTVHTDVRHVALEKIGFHLKHHDSRLYKCAHCIYFHYQKSVVEKHTIDKHPDRRYFIHAVREPKPVATSEEESDSSTTVWKCALCKDYQSPFRSSVLDHLSKNHGTRSLYKCQLCEMKSNHYQSFTPHFASKHPGENISYFPTMVKDTFSSPESTAVSESKNDHFDTTPLWKRDASRVRHIRGILIEEEEKQEVIRKKVKKTAEHNESTSTPARTSNSARTATPALARTSTPTPARTRSSAPTRTSTPAPTRTSTPVSTSSRTQAPVLTPSRVQPPTPIPAPARSQAETAAPAQTQTSTSAQTLAQNSTSAPAQTQNQIPAPARTQAETAAPTQIQTSTPAPVQTQNPIQVPPRIMILSPPPTQTQNSAPARTQAETAAHAQTHNPISVPPRMLILTPVPPPTQSSAPAPALTENSTSAPARSQTSTPAPAQTQKPIPVSPRMLILTPVPPPTQSSTPAPALTENSTSTPAQTQNLSPPQARTQAETAAPPRIMILSPPPAHAQNSTPASARTQAETAVPARIPSTPASAQIMILTPVSPPTQNSNPLPARTHTLTPAPAQNPISTPAPVQTSTPNPVQTQKPIPVPIMILTPVSAPTQNPMPAPALIQTSTPAPTQTLNSTPVPSRIQAETATPIQTRTSARIQASNWTPSPAGTYRSSQLANSRWDWTKRRVRPKKEKPTPPAEDKAMTFWVNSIIEQQRIEIERKRLETPDSPRRRRNRSG